MNVHPSTILVDKIKVIKYIIINCLVNYLIVKSRNVRFQKVKSQIVIFLTIIIWKVKHGSNKTECKTT